MSAIRKFVEYVKLYVTVLELLNGTNQAQFLQNVL